MELKVKKPYHKVEETDEAIFIDDFRVDYVLENSVSAKKLSPTQTIVTLSFIAERFERTTTKD